MSPKKRLPENTGLPKRWVFKHGKFYYLPRSSEKHLFDNKTWFLLGKTLAQAHRNFAERIEYSGELQSMSD